MLGLQIEELKDLAAVVERILLGEAPPESKSLRAEALPRDSDAEHPESDRAS